MKNDTTTLLAIPEASTRDVLTEILRDGAREMLGNAIEAEVADYIAVHAHQRDADGHRLVVRNGYATERELQTGLGAIPVKTPRISQRFSGFSVGLQQLIELLLQLVLNLKIWRKHGLHCPGLSCC